MGKSFGYDGLMATAQPETSFQWFIQQSIDIVGDKKNQDSRPEKEER